MDKDLIQLLGLNETEVVTNYGDDETILFTVVLDESMGSEMRVGIIGI
ncbi:hypothetical protein [Clostridium sp.]|nr:hypothetical protein [Clostridium sp.]MBK5242550.1 hypothetical protein [Clostridium sp.]